jgi:hypothetical protein
MSAFDPPPSTTETPANGAAALIAKIKAVAKAYPYPTFVVAAFLALGVVSFLVAAFSSPAPTAPTAVAVPAGPAPAATPGVAPGAAPAPAQGFNSPAAPAQTPAAAVGAVVLPPTHPLDTAVERGSSISVALETSGEWDTQKQQWVEVSTVPVAPTDSVAGFTYAGARTLLSNVWPAKRERRRIAVSGLAKIETAGTYTLVLSEEGQGSFCQLELGPRGNVVASLEGQSRTNNVTATEKPLDAGFYRVALACSTRLWDNDNGGATVAIRTAGGSPRVIELFNMIETADPAAPAPTPADAPAASGA